MLRSSSTRRSVTCVGGDSSPISSSRKVPPCASSMRPFLATRASLCAPLAWPKSASSSRVSGNSAQFTGTKGPFARRLRSWSARATSSLPVPLSPVIRTVLSVAAALRTVATTRWMAALTPTTASTPDALAALRPQVMDLGPEPAVLEGSVDAVEHLVVLEGLGDEVGGAEPHGVDGHVHAPERGHHDELRVRGHLLHVAEEIELRRGPPSSSPR